MKWEKIRDKSGHIRYKVNGKQVEPKPANEIANSMISSLNVYPDSLTVIDEVEAELDAHFVIDHTVKLDDGGIFARADNGAVMELYDDHIVVKKADGTVKNYLLDISETRCIAELRKGNFTITGNSGTTYTFSAKFEVIGIETKTENLRNFIINNRVKAVDEGKSEIKARAA
ncbi:MAG: hypothetical protein IJS29_01100 [Selenomonadaceae bacterium]|nr:hypothetical protein [Selenomonadaceae bacterium]